MTLREEKAIHLRESLSRITEKCYKGNHDFVEIFESGNDIESKVVRWCETCGSITIDTDFDGRTNPGAVMKLRSPAICRSSR